LYELLILTEYRRNATYLGSILPFVTLR